MYLGTVQHLQYFLVYVLHSPVLNWCKAILVLGLFQYSVHWNATWLLQYLSSTSLCMYCIGLYINILRSTPDFVVVRCCSTPLHGSMRDYTFHVMPDETASPGLIIPHTLPSGVSPLQRGVPFFIALRHTKHPGAISAYTACVLRMSSSCTLEMWACCIFHQRERWWSRLIHLFQFGCCLITDLQTSRSQFRDNERQATYDARACVLSYMLMSATAAPANFFFFFCSLMPANVNTSRGYALGKRN